MKPLLVTLGMLALLAATSQLVRHLYVLWMPPNASLIDQYDDRAARDPLAALGIEELAKKYDDIRRQIKSLEAGKPAEERGKINIWEEPYKTEDKLRNAIQTWEARDRELNETHWFWWAGLIVVGLGIGVFWQGNRWLGIAALTTGLLEMLYSTSPNLRFFGGMIEFQRLIVWKLIYSAATLAILIGLWLGLSRAVRFVPRA